jgi:glycosyltransferase involved in cell wall biosynthesis
MTDAAPFFSVIIPTYNRADLVGKAVESVLNQRFGNHEILVIDNRSTDDTRRVMQKYIDARQVTYIQNDRNYERSYSRNVGLEHARGRYVTLLDSDDVLYPDCLQDAFTFASQNPDVWFFHCLYEAIDHEYRALKPVRFASIVNPFKELMEGNFISNIGVFYKRELASRLRFDESPAMIGAEDYDFVIRALAEAGTLGRIDKVNAGVLSHPNRSVNLERWDTTYARIRHFIDKQLGSALFLQHYGPYVETFVANLQLYLCGFLATRGHSARAVRFLLMALRSDWSLVRRKKWWTQLFVILKYAPRPRQPWDSPR